MALSTLDPKTALVVVGFTARQAFELGFNVSLGMGAVSELDAETHANSVNRIFPKLRETGMTHESIELLAGRG